jgi:RNA polymerase sigma factor (sigma-70 family)
MTSEDYRIAQGICRQQAKWYARKLPVWLQRMVDVEDLSQLAIIAVWGKITSPYSDHGGLIKRVARAAIVDHLRTLGLNRQSGSSQDRKAIAGVSADFQQLAGALDLNLTHSESSDFRVEDLDAYHALREPYQRVIRDVADGLKSQELADRDGITVDTCRWRIWRAITDFRQSLTPRDCDRLGLNTDRRNVVCK